MYKSCENCGWFEHSSMLDDEDEGICAAVPPTTIYNADTLKYHSVRTHTMTYNSGCRFWKPKEERNAIV